MSRLVKTDFAASGKLDLDNGTPSGFLYVRTPDALLSEHRNFGLQIITHEIEFEPVVLLGGMHRHFRRRQREDEPSVARVHGFKSQDIAEEGTISLRIFAVDNYMRAKDHGLYLFSPEYGRRKTPSKLD
jgi:hypothetical protein